MANAGSQIVTQTISAVVDQRAGLYNSWIARPHGIPPFTWNTLRMGIRFQTENIGANLAGTARFFLGFCSGISKPVGALVTNAALGLVTDLATWTYTAAAAGNMTRYSGLTTKIVKLVNTGAFTSFGSGSQALTHPADPTAATRRMMVLDFVRTSATVMTVSALYCNSAVAAPDVTANDFLQVMSLPTPAFTNHTYLSFGTISYNEPVDGVLDCVNVSWDRTVMGVHVCDIGVVRVS